MIMKVPKNVLCTYSFNRFWLFDSNLLENAKDMNNEKKIPQNAFISKLKKLLFYIQNA